MTDVTELQKRGWRYFDVPWCHEADWNKFLEAMGGSNFEFLACTKHTGEDGVVRWRGQIMISPEGVTHLKRKLRGNTVLDFKTI